jgi:UPF0755 protein
MKCKSNKILKTKNKRRLNSVVFILLLLTVVLFVVGGWWKQSLKPAQIDSQQEVDFVVKAGEVSGLIADRLKESGLVRSSLATKLYLKINHLENKLQAGEYRLSPHLSIAQLMEQLQHGSFQHKLTIPEGYRLEQVTGWLCRQNLVCTEGYQSLLATLQLQIGEGYFYPDTYYLEEDSHINKLLELVKSNFTKNAQPLLKPELLSNSLTPEQTVILASLIEREAKTDDERSTIAGIILNRLSKDWPLQVDATVQYLKGCSFSVEDQLNCQNNDWWSDQLTRLDIGRTSAYNTYENIGLPPAPICNPGLASIKAAIQPATTDYFYYLHDKQGGVHYAVDLAGHEQNIKDFLP